MRNQYNVAVAMSRRWRRAPATSILPIQSHTPFPFPKLLSLPFRLHIAILAPLRTDIIYDTDTAGRPHIYKTDLQQIVVIQQ
jgi:hypothetical protein